MDRDLIHWIDRSLQQHIVAMIIMGDAKARHQVDAVVSQSSTVSCILFAIYISVLSTCIQVNF